MQWLLIAFVVQGVLTAALVFGLPMVLPMLDFEGQNGMIVCIPVWFLGGLLVGMISPGPHVHRAGGRELRRRHPDDVPAHPEPDRAHDADVFLYVILAAIGILFTLIGAYIGERIQLGPPPKTAE